MEENTDIFVRGATLLMAGSTSSLAEDAIRTNCSVFSICRKNAGSSPTQRGAVSHMGGGGPSGEIGHGRLREGRVLRVGSPSRAWARPLPQRRELPASGAATVREPDMSEEPKHRGGAPGAVNCGGGARGPWARTTRFPRAGGVRRRRSLRGGRGDRGRGGRWRHTAREGVRCWFWSTQTGFWARLFMKQGGARSDLPGRGASETFSVVDVSLVLWMA